MDGPVSRRALAAGALFAALAVAAGARAVRGADRAGRVTFDIRVVAPPEAKDVKLWFPYPTSDLEQSITDLRFDGDYDGVTMAREPQSGALYLYARWGKERPERRLRVTFQARSKERRVPFLADTGDPIPPDVRRYLESSFWLPSDDPKVKALAAQIVAGKTSPLSKARAIYDWMVDNTRRDPEVPGCGTGEVDRALAARSGKCADLSSVYVALARAAGVAAREVFGLRLGQRGQTDITNEHHCWAEFYLPGTGWVPVDPADVVRIMVERNLTVGQVERERAYYFGGVDEFRIVLHRGGRGLSFAEGNAAKVNYFMYPYAEVDGAPLDYCRPSSFAYTIRFEEG
jgi:transglutaminase-like putative cysteine protease